jgi:signal transduction histidine kinase
MKMKTLYNYLTPVLLGVLMFASNFLNTQIFNFAEHNFAVWFVLSVLCFACGWYINKTFGWHFGGKVVFATIVSATAISIILISFFRDYFAANQLLTENLILYSLRNVTLGAMAFFGMALVEVLSMQKHYAVTNEKMKLYDEMLKDAKREAELEIREARINTKKIINDAEAEAKNITLKKERIESELKEFIQAEKELIKKYEDAGK